MKTLCKIMTPYTCKECGEEMLFFVTGNPKYIIDYKMLVIKQQRTANEIYNILIENNVSYIKCLVCNKKYIIDWSNIYPEQLIDKSSLFKFMSTGN